MELVNTKKEEFETFGEEVREIQGLIVQPTADEVPRASSG